MDTFGELPKDYKSNKISHWKERGLITNNYNEIYEKYIISTHCDKCQQPYKNRTDKCMDHNHHTNEGNPLFHQLQWYSVYCLQQQNYFLIRPLIKRRSVPNF